MAPLRVASVGWNETLKEPGLRHRLRSALGAVGYRMRADEDLMALAGRGDGRAFDEIVRRHRGRIYALATGVLDRDEAADVLQEVLLAAYRDRQAPESRSDVKGWLYVHTARAIFGRFRSRHPKLRANGLAQIAAAAPPA